MSETTTLDNSQYEIMFILPPDLGEEASGKELEEVRKLIAENGGKITFEDILGVREFAYRIKKQDKGYYAVFNFEMVPENLPEMEKPLNLNQNILRHIIIKTPKNYENKTLAEYAEEAEKEAKEQEKAKKAEKAQGSKPAVTKKAPAKKKNDDEKEVKTVNTPKETSVKEEKTDLSDVDEKLKSIIDDPDITL